MALVISTCSHTVDKKPTISQKKKSVVAKTCDEGNSKKCFDLGVRYANGKGVKQDYFKAKELFGKACDMKEAKGCENYARLNKE